MKRDLLHTNRTPDRGTPIDWVEEFRGTALAKLRLACAVPRAPLAGVYHEADNEEWRCLIAGVETPGEKAQGARIGKGDNAEP